MEFLSSEQVATFGDRAYKCITSEFDKLKSLLYCTK